MSKSFKWVLKPFSVSLEVHAEATLLELVSDVCFVTDLLGVSCHPRCYYECVCFNFFFLQEQPPELMTGGNDMKVFIALFYGSLCEFCWCVVGRTPLKSLSILLGFASLSVTSCGLNSSWYHVWFVWENHCYGIVVSWNSCFLFIVW